MGGETWFVGRLHNQEHDTRHVALLPLEIIRSGRVCERMFRGRPAKLAGAPSSCSRALKSATCIFYKRQTALFSFVRLGLLIADGPSGGAGRSIMDVPMSSTWQPCLALVRPRFNNDFGPSA
jgi:hypothetical protein